MRASMANSALLARPVPPTVQLEAERLKFIVEREFPVARCLVVGNNVGVIIFEDAATRDAAMVSLQGTPFPGGAKLQLSHVGEAEQCEITRILSAIDAQNKASTVISDIVGAINDLDGPERERIKQSITPGSGSKTKSRLSRNALLTSLDEGRDNKRDPVHSHSTPKMTRLLGAGTTMVVDTESIVSAPKVSVFTGCVQANGEVKSGETSFT